MKFSILFFLFYLLGFSSFSEESDNNTSTALPRCEGDACNAIKLFNSQNSFWFENKNGNNDRFQIGNDIKLKVYYTKHVMANCGFIKTYTLKYGETWNAGSIMLCDKKSYIANYVNKKGTKGDQKF